MGVLGIILKAAQAEINTAYKREDLKLLLDVQEVAAAKCPPQKMRETHRKRRNNHRRRRKKHRRRKNIEEEGNPSKMRKNHRIRRKHSQQKAAASCWTAWARHPGRQVHCGSSVLKVVVGVGRVWVCPAGGPLVSDWCAASYAGAAVVGQRATVGQRDKLLLPLLVERAAAPLPQDALRREPITASGGRCSQVSCRKWAGGVQWLPA